MSGGISWFLLKPLTLLQVCVQDPKLDADCGGAGTQRREKAALGKSLFPLSTHSTMAVIWDMALPGENS